MDISVVELFVFCCCGGTHYVMVHLKVFFICGFRKGFFDNISVRYCCWKLHELLRYCRAGVVPYVPIQKFSTPTLNLFDMI